MLDKDDDTAPQATTAPRAARRWLRIALLALVVLVLSGAQGLAAVEAYIDSVHLPSDPLAPQASVLYYRDGHTILARVGTTDHTDVPLSAISVDLRHAVLAAEDRGFYNHGGVSARGVFRALVADVRGDGQGASTITQQYARNAYLTQKFSFDRKAKEFALAIKLERRYSKDEILDRYLNSVYFGRGAYGIAAAAHAYFGISPDRLSLAQSAVLAAVVKDPWHYDPAVSAQDARDRWSWIVAAVRSQGWVGKKTAANLRYPDVLPKSGANGGLSGPNGLVVDQVERELNSHGIPPQMLHTSGLSVVTTLDPLEQSAALSLVRGTLRVQPDGLRAALVAVDPATGAVRAYYGGDHGSGYFDDATAARPPASTFKPVALAAGLQQGIGYLSRWDGSSPRNFPDRNGVPLVNHDSLQCPNCTLEESMVRSLNTPFYALTEQIGPAKVRDLAIALGIAPTYGGNPSLVDLKGDPRPGKTRAEISIGRYPVTPADLATVYATFAAGGVRSTRYFVQSATAGHTVLWTGSPERSQVLDPRVVADVSTVLQAVVDGHGLQLGRPAAGKTGTQEWGNTRDNQDAWMAGYTPQLATVVWLGRSVPGPIRDTAGNPIAGETLPSWLWKDFLSTAMRGEADVQFPAAAHVGRIDVGDAGRANPDAPAGSPNPAQGTQPVSHTARQGKYLALTLDDGPSVYTSEVLDLLATYHVKATFCLVGENVQAHPVLVRRMVADGHALCNHSLHHDDLGNATPAQIRADLSATDAAIAQAVPGSTVTYFRAPYGDWGATSRVATDLGHTPLGWAVDPDDWKLPGVNTIAMSIRTHLRPGDVVLVHDGGGDRQQTVDALKILIPELLQQGWTFDLPQTTVQSHAAQPPASSSATPETTGSASPSKHPTPPPDPTPAGGAVGSGGPSQQLSK